ncbi:type II toxin-antitoxin system VapC family toxin [Chloroflexota bacterium]
MEQEGWECSTSRFTILELLDIEQEDRYIQNLLNECHRLSRVRDLLGQRRQKNKGLTKRELDEVYEKLHDELRTKCSCVNYEHPINEEIWNMADDFCAATNIGAFDVIHLASAIILNCDVLVTRDQDFRSIADDYILSIFPENIDSALTILTNSQMKNIKPLTCAQ